MKFGNIIRLSRIILIVFSIILACQKYPLVDELKPQISLLQIEYNQSKLRLDQLKAENTELKRKFSSLQESYAVLQKQYQDELSSSEVLQIEINAIEKQLQTTIENNRLQYANLLTELKQLTEKVESKSEELKQHEENQQLLEETTKAFHQIEKSQSALQEFQSKITEFQIDLNELLIKKEEYERLESEHVSQLGKISQLEKQIDTAEKTLEKLKLDAEINQLDQQLSHAKSTIGLIEKVENDLVGLTQEIKNLSTFSEMLPKLKEVLSKTIESEKNLQLQLGDLKAEFYLLTRNTPPPPPIVYGPAIRVDSDMPKRLFLGDVYKLNYNFYNEEGTLTQPTGLVLWSSDNEKIIEIDKVSGEIQARGLGTAQISITTQIDDQIYEDTLTIDVSNLLKHRIEIIGDKPQVLIPHEKYDLEFAYFDERGKKVTQPPGEALWKSSDNQVISINPNTGEIRALTPGSASITITLEHPETGLLTYSYRIQVQSDSLPPILIIDERPNNSRIAVNETYDLNFEYYDSLGQKVDPPTGLSFIWSSSDTTKVTIDSSTGVIRGVAIGTSVISISTVIEGQLISDHFTISVYDGSVSNDAHRIEIVEEGFPDPFLVGQTHRFTVKFYDSNENIITPPSGTAVWKSSKNRNARPNSDNSGDVTAERKGEATIQVIFTIDGNSKELTDSFDITVEQGPAIRIIKDTFPSNFSPPQTFILTYHYWNANGVKVNPPDGIRWKSATKKVATIDNSTGEVTAVSAGTSLITITTQESNKDNRIDDTYEITVLGAGSTTVEPEIRIINPSNSPTIFINGTLDLDFEYRDENGNVVNLPQGATIAWTSSDTTKITVDASTGVITGISAGNSDITVSATINSNIISATQTITVAAGSLRSDGSRIEIQEDIELFFVGQTHTFTFSYYDSSNTQTTVPAGSAKWSSSNDKLTFSTTNIGAGTGGGMGLVTITVRYTFNSDGNYLEDTYQLRVIQGPLIRILENLPQGFKTGQTHTLTAEYYDATGNKITHPDGLSWESSSESVATINQNGEVTAVGAGNVRIRVTTQESNSNDRISDNYRFDVLTDPELKIIDLPASSTIAANGTHDLNYEYYDQTGTKVDLPQGATIAWTSSDTTKITVDASTGMITAVSAGNSDITVRATIGSNTLTATQTITVSASSLRSDGSYIKIQEDLPELFFVGQTHSFTIKYYNSSDAEIPLAAGSASWSSNNDKLTFSTTNIGDGTGAGMGLVTITVRYTFNSDGNYLEDTYQLRVIQGPLIRIIENLPQGFKIGQTHTLTAEYYGATGNKITHPDGLSWSGGDDTVATVDSSTGEVTAVGPGTVTITITTLESDANSRINDTYEFDVLTDPEIRIVDLPTNSSIDVNETHTLDYEYYDNTGTKVDLPIGATIAWTSSDSTKISVNSAGIISGVGAGSANITATISGTSISNTITITILGIARTDGSRIEIQEDIELFFVGQTHTFTFSYYDSSNTQTTVPAGSAKWSSSNDKLTFSTTNIGAGTGGGMGLVTITVRYTFNSDGNYLEDTYQLRVIQGPLIRILENLPQGFKTGQTHTLTAEYYDATGNKITHPDGLSWESSSESVATINQNGEVTAVGAGNVRIRVTTQESNSNDRISDNYRFDVLTDPELKIIDLPASSTIAANGTHDLNYEYYDQTGTKVDLPQGATIAWTSSDTTKITVDASTGMITAVSAGNSDITVRATINGNTISATQTITVTAPMTVPARIEIVEDIPLPFIVGQTHRLTFDYYNTQGMKTTAPSGSSVWTSSRNRTARPNVDNSGDITAEQGNREVTITLTYTLDSDSSVLTDTYDITVDLTGPGIRIFENIPTTFATGDTHTLEYLYWNTANQAIASPTGVRWTSKDTDVATIDPNSGTVTAKAAGTVIIQVRTKEDDKDDRVLDTYEFTVN